MLSLNVQSWAEEPGPGDVVATVNGEPIYYSDFLVDARGYELSFWAEQGRKPISKEDQEAVRKNIETDNMSNLRNVIDHTFVDQWVKNQKIVVTEEEHDKYWEQFKSIIESKNTAISQEEFNEFQEDRRLELEAGKAVYDEGKDPEQVFADFTKATSYSGSRAQWELKIYLLMRPEFRKIYEKQSTQTWKESWEESKKNFYIHVLEFKVDSRVYELIARNDKDMRDWLKNNPPKFNYATLEYFEDPMYKKRCFFWQELFKKADIKIIDSKYEKVLEHIPTSWRPRWIVHLRSDLQ